MNTHHKTQLQLITIDANFAGQRLDNFLLNKLKNVPKSHIYRLLRKGEVRVNKKRCDPMQRLQENDQVRIPPMWLEETPAKGQPSRNARDLLLSRIIYEDAGLLVINKPSGMASHGGSGVNFGVIETLRAARPDIHNLELIHRLDRGTSGCLMLAKKRSMLRKVHELLREGKVIKKYLVLVRGVCHFVEKTVDLPLLKNQLLSGERVVNVDEEGKSTLTIFRPTKLFANASLLEAELHTGRTHQIRVHAAAIGHPVAGDEKYGDPEFNAQMKKFGLNRLFLHAKSINFTLDEDREVSISADLDNDLTKVLANFS